MGLRSNVCRKPCTLRRRCLLLCLLGGATLSLSVTYLSGHSLLLSRVSDFPRRSLVRLGRDILGPFSDAAAVSTARNDATAKCGSVFPGMLRGRWVPKRNVSAARREEMEEYLIRTRGEYRIPRSLQRPDGRCGNIPYDGVALYRHMWFRSLCDPRGPTPCCHNFVCSNHSVEQCRCPLCLDPRTPVHAELSDWLPELPACRAREFSAREACELLKGTTVVMAGDSFVRHMFVALVMLLTDSFNDGALKRDAPPAVRRMCLGMYQINGLRCREILDENRTLCEGQVRATYLEIFTASKGRFLLPHLHMLARLGHPRVLLLAGLGIHDDFRAQLIWPMFLQPLVDFFGNSTQLTSPPQRTEAVSKSPGARSSALARWPKMVWVNTHAPGLLKSPLFPAQSFEGVQFYNEEVARLLEPRGIPILDSFNMTAPLHSVDGTHYGYGANTLKVHFLLNWITERRDRGEW